VKEDFLAVVEQKRFLGREFLTWLVWTIEEGGGRIERDGDVVELQLGDRVTLAGTTADRARLTVAGTGDLRAEMGAGLRRGKLLDQAKLVLLRGERRWELSLDGGLLTYDGLRCPALGPRDAAAPEDRRAAFENDLYLRLADVDDAVGIIDRLFAEFCRARAASSWRARTLPALRAWVDDIGR
jgi:recombination associated protein RdgC